MRFFFKCSLLVLFLLPVLVVGQTLTGQTIGGSAEMCLSSCSDYSIYRDPNVDIHHESGKVVYTWLEQDVPASGSNKDIYCQIFDKDLNALTAKFRVNSFTNLDQAIAVPKINQEDGTVTIGWQSNHGTDYDIYIKKFSLNITDPSTVLSSNEILVPQTNTGNQVAVKLAFDYASNELIVGWRDDSGRDSLGTGGTLSGGSGIYARRVNYSTFAFVGNEFILNDKTKNNQIFGDIEVSPLSGELVVVYASMQTGNSDIFLRRFTKNTDGTYSPSSAVRVNSNLTYLASSQWRALLTMNKSNGDLIVSYNSDGQDGAGRGVFFKVYDKNGNVVKDETLGTAVGADSQTGLKVLIDEETGNLINFYIWGANSSSTLRYQLFDKQYNLIGGEGSLIGSGLISNWDGLFNACYSQNFEKIYLGYGVYSGNNNVAKARVYNYALPQNRTTVTGSYSTSDDEYNWTQVTEFDEYGEVIVESRSYSDGLGKALQSQGMDLENNKILATSTFYDLMGRPAIQTLPAPIFQNSFNYRADFATGTVVGDPYKPSYWDGTKTNIPDPVGTDSPLGKYYSTSNTDEPYQATTSYPYSRVAYNDQMGGVLTKASSAGEALRMGQGHESSSINMPILWELDNYLKLRPNYVPGTMPSNLIQKGYKVITKDENKNEIVTFYDNDGKTLATASFNGPFTVTHSLANTSDSYELSITYSNGVYPFQISGSGTFKIFINGNSSPSYQGTSASMPVGVSLFTLGSNLRIVSDANFSLNYSGIKYPTLIQSIDISSHLDFHLMAGSETSLVLGGTFELYNLETEALVSYTQGTTILQAGYYRLKRVANNPQPTIIYIQKYTGFTYYYYDDAGRLVAKVYPSSTINSISNNDASLPTMADRFEYNSIGQLIAVTTPDQGRTEYIYKNDGQLKFSQTAQQKQDNKYSYNHFNNLDFLIEKGERKPAASGTTGLVFQNMKDYENGVGVCSGCTSTSSPTVKEEIVNVHMDFDACIDYSSIVYNTPDPTVATHLPGYIQRYTNGGVSKTFNKNKATWYSYDEQGNLESSVQKIEGFGVKTFYYKYDLSGKLLTVDYNREVASERFGYMYSYDKNQAIKKVYTRVGLGGYTEQAEYIYALHGPVKRVEIAENLQGIDYTYTINGWIKGINHPYAGTDDPGADGYTGSHSQFRKDVFGMMLEYYDQDYVRSNKFKNSTGLPGTPSTHAKFNGLIRASTWSTNKDPLVNTVSSYAYGYYNDYKISEAVFGFNNTSTSAFTYNPAYYVAMTYNNNGGLMDMLRKNESGTSSNLDNINYKYQTNTNRVTSTESSEVSPNQLTRAYAYNLNGQMITWAGLGGTAGSITYNRNGLVESVKNPGGYLIVYYTYDEKGKRLSKTNYNPASPYNATKTTYYVYDAAGNTASIYTKDLLTSAVEQEIPVYGAEDRIGIYYKLNNEYNYELSDHLGSVRAVIRKNSSVAAGYDILSYADYYPFGSTMPGRTFSTYYRHGYQGQFSEKDNETDWNAFDLRMYDSKVGLWLSPDPYGQFLNPYVGMGNDPVNGVDPDGGYVPPKGSGLARGIWWNMKVGFSHIFGNGFSTAKWNGINMRIGGGGNIFSNITLSVPVVYGMSSGYLNDDQLKGRSPVPLGREHFARPGRQRRLPNPNFNFRYLPNTDQVLDQNVVDQAIQFYNNLAHPRNRLTYPNANRNNVRINIRNGQPFPPGSTQTFTIRGTPTVGTTQAQRNSARYQSVRGTMMNNGVNRDDINMGTVTNGVPVPLIGGSITF